MPSKQLKNILPEKTGWRALKEVHNAPVNGMTFDSRKVEKNWLFAAVLGNALDGHDYIENAIESGATYIVCERRPDKIHDDVNYLMVDNTASAMAEMAQKFFDNPSEKIKLVGITGTNGKTTVATLLYRAWLELGVTAGLISTVEISYADVVIPAELTTPDIITLNGLLYEMLQNGVTHTAMEVSSHAIDQGRIKDIRFHGGVFTNISHDHLDYHGDMSTYIAVKRSFFQQLPKDAFALINADDPRGKVMLEKIPCRFALYSLSDLVEYKGKIINMDLMGMLLEVNEMRFYSRLTGWFNAYNLLAVLGVLDLMKYEMHEIARVLSVVKTAEGRFECMFDESKGRVAIIDYAHTPDALENVLKTIRRIGVKGRLVTVMGCGGNRDKKKRPIMAKVAARWSDQVVMTSDNPRFEDPKDILMDMSQGLDEEDKRKTLSIENREEAIKAAYMMSKEGDVILIAGKGHEKYQEIKGIKYPFDDKKVISALMKDA